jgi:hypothetical protein
MAKHHAAPPRVVTSSILPSGMAATEVNEGWTLTVHPRVGGLDFGVEVIVQV